MKELLSILFVILVISPVVLLFVYALTNKKGREVKEALPSSPAKPVTLRERIMDGITSGGFLFFR